MTEMSIETKNGDINPTNLVSSHIDFISYADTSEEKKAELGKQFSENFLTLSLDRQEGVRQSLAGITSDIQELPNLHPGVSYIRNNLICDRIVELFGEVGVVNSVIPGGVEEARRTISPYANSIVRELDSVEKRAKKELNPKTSEDIGNIGGAIKEEMDRLGLVPKESNTQNEKEEGIRRILTLGDSLKILSRYELIGFSRLQSLTEVYLQYLRAARQTEDFYITR